MVDPRIPSTALSPEEAAPCTGFVAQAPNSNYTLNEREKGVPIVDLCRVGAGQKDCVEIHQDVTKLFALLTDQGFFCQTALNPGRTDIECTRINKIIERQS